MSATQDLLDLLEENGVAVVGEGRTAVAGVAPFDLPDSITEMLDDDESCGPEFEPMVLRALPEGWVALTGFSGAHASASTAIMHQSEFVSRKMADGFLDEPGMYRVIDVYGVTDGPDAESEPMGWLIAHRPAEDEAPRTVTIDVGVVLPHVAPRFTRWLDSSEKVEADMVSSLMRASTPRDDYSPDEQADDAYNALRAAYLDRAEQHVVRLEAIVDAVLEKARSHDRGRGRCVCAICAIMHDAGYSTKDV